MKEMLPTPEHIPGGYRRDPSHTGLVIDRDVYVPMRDGVRLCVDVYRPRHRRPLPALLAFAIYNKEIQAPDHRDAAAAAGVVAAVDGAAEAGDTRFLVARGYVHVIGMPRGIGKSEGGGSREWDCYDLIEWIAAAALVRRQRRHDRHLRRSAPSRSTSRASTRRASRRSSPSTPAAPTARSAASARSIRAASCTCSATSWATSASSTRTVARPASCRRRRRSCGGRRWTTRTTGCTRTSTTSLHEGPAHAA